MLPAAKSILYRSLKQLAGSRFHYYLKYFQHHQFKPYAQLQVLQHMQLEQLLMEAGTDVPFYRERFRETGLNHPSDLQNLPLLTRSDIRQHSLALQHQRMSPETVQLIQTGGSTGAPLKIVHDKTFRDCLQASTSFYYSWSGLNMGVPYFLLWGAYQDLHRQLHHWRDQFVVGFLQGRRILNCRVTSDDLMSRFIDAMNAQTDCNYLVGYAKELYALACFSQEYRKPVTGRFNAIYATAETLTEPMRQTIQTVFGAPVLNRYGCRDAGDIACECPYQKGLHINPLYSLVEVVDADGRPLPYGEEGDIVLTVLHNRAMPLIRYAVGDRGILKPAQRCPCGREWESLVCITGRSSDVLYLKDGSRFGGGFLYTAFEHLPGLQRFQIHQYSPVHLKILIRSPIQDYMQRFEEALSLTSEKIQQWAGYPMLIEFEQADTFNRTETGKELLIINRMYDKVDSQSPQALSLAASGPVA